ncbi:MAG: PepSY-like domain-containing protein [Flavobacterium sp.]|nr:PepSY-like domain-containing protein [Flavobacterium sp.]
MKKVFLLVAMYGFFIQSQAQSVMTKDVPASIKAGFKKAHPNAKNLKWIKEGTTFESEFTENGGERSATFDDSGLLLESEKNIKIASLPAPVAKYVADNHKGKKITEASKIKDRKGVVTYEAEVNGMDLIFDAKGNYIKSVKD